MVIEIDKDTIENAEKFRDFCEFLRGDLRFFDEVTVRVI